MKQDSYDQNAERELIARLDRLPLWPHSSAVLWVVGIGYLIAFFDITNVAFGLPVFSKVLHFTAEQQAIPITASLVGYVVGSWLNSNLADAIGRKGGIMTATLLFTIGCIGTTFAMGLTSMVVGRFVTGMGIGAEIAVISAYIGEMAPAAVRGRYTGLANVFAMLGQGVVPIVALALVPNFAWGWRAMFCLGALGGLTLFAFPWLPESPRWLLSKRRMAEAASVIDAAEARARLRIGGDLPLPIEVAAEVHSQGFPTAALFRAPFAGRVVLLFVLWFIWYIGTYTWLGLGPTFFVARGYTLTHSILFMLASSVGYPVGSLLATALGDAFERKHTIFAGMLLWTACFVAIGIAGSPLLIYVAVFLLAGSLGFFLPLMYALTAESFPTRARATGVSLTDGAGHLGGAAGPIMALAVYSWGGISSGFTTVFLFMAATGLITATILPFTINATRKSLEVVSRE
ncbi:MFS transporter [Acidiphilium sp. AL]|uniref:MFS transporter n=1 Tax=Acidiphilium iwatense TaxID=768198 RepID=A0ABS9DYE8_9PROT|nr:MULTISPECIES: MFS transporter [Acidiphilium]MCF3947713.1 MFS transporter [Acidiphilium iwatense]MCU4160069.1 MFS transporter [Acidiphilium sp. AL]